MSACFILQYRRRAMSTMPARQELEEMDINNLYVVLEELDMEELALKERDCKE